MVKILVVDDEKLIANSLGRIIKMAGHQVEVVNSGIDAIKSLSKNTYQIVFLDFLMPDINGDEILKKIKTNNPENTKVIMMTAYGDQTSLDLRNKGADLVLSKPFEDITQIPSIILKTMNC